MRNEIKTGGFCPRYRSNILLFLLTIGIFTGCALLYGWETEAVIYAALLAFFLGGSYLLYEMIREGRRARDRKRLIAGISSAWQNLPPANSPVEADYQEMVEKLGKELYDLQTLRAQEQKELIDYYTTWVHQIKTPIAVSRLLLDQNDTELSHSLEQELFRIEQYVEMALTYTRLDTDASDLVIREYDLDELIRTAIRKYAGQFIGRRIRLVYEPTAAKIVTDQKWFLTILEQLLSNAVKYTPQGEVRIIAGENALSVTDTGIGIDPADLPRIFEKGYTGINGRSNFKSTGLGLYLCHKAADKLNIRLTASSTPGQGSTFTLQW